MTEERKLIEDLIDKELYNEAIERMNRADRKIFTAKEALELLELNDAISNNKDLIDILNDAIGSRALTTDLNSHTSNESNPHKVTKDQIGLSNVENKSSENIRSEITKDNVTSALGFVPPVKDTTYELATTNTDGLLIITQNNATHGAVVKLMDEARNTGVTNISITEY